MGIGERNQPSSPPPSSSSTTSAAAAASSLIRSKKNKRSASDIRKKQLREERQRRQQQQHLLGGEEIRSTGTAENADQAQPITNNNNEVDTSSSSFPVNSSIYGSGMGMMTPYGGMGGMYGMGGMGLGGMYGMGMGGGMGMGMGMGSQWLMSFNQLLFGIQSVVFSLGQAVQIVGMNAQQIRHVYESVKGMVENALGYATNKLGGKAINAASLEKVGHEARRWLLLDDASGGDRCHDNDGSSPSSAQEGEEDGRSRLTQNDIVRRRRLAAFRWTMTLSASYFIYKAVRRVLLRALTRDRGIGGGAGSNLPLQQYQPSLGQQYYSGVSNNEYYDRGRSGGFRGYGMHGYNDDAGGQHGYFGQQRRPHDPYSQHSYGSMDGRYY
jgi:hypothetical protein